MKIFIFVPFIAVALLGSCSVKSNITQSNPDKTETNVSQTDKQNVESIIKGSLDKEGKVVITHINFEKGSIEVPEDSDESIKALTNYLKENTSVTMNVACYTDEAGSPAYCIDLSKKRAQNISNKFKKYGIDENRVSFSGEGWQPGTLQEEQGERLEIELVH